MFLTALIIILEIVITRAAPAFRKMFMVMGCVFDGMCAFLSKGTY